MVLLFNFQMPNFKFLYEVIPNGNGTFVLRDLSFGRFIQLSDGNF